MNKTNELYRLLNKGGVLSPALLQNILLVAESAGNDHVFMGSRQDLLFYLPTDFKPERLNGLSIHKRNSGLQNVVSSFACVDILPSTSWVYSGIYLKVMEQFKNDHQLRVNIVDPHQNMVPLFYGHLNFIASEIPNYWHLHLNLDTDNELKIWPGLIFTDDIAGFSKILEELILIEKIQSFDALTERMANTLLQKNTLPNTDKLKLPSGFFPYYEGLNKMDGKEQYWAGFYWRNNHYPVNFLKEICTLCQKTNIGKISFTPWKTFLIKDIDAKDKKYWDELIGRYGINMRHSSFELNWHLPLLDKHALKLKRYLVAEFDKFDIRTFGLSFAIQNQPVNRFTSIVIRYKSRLPFLGKYDFTRTYSIEYAYDYNPNSNYYLEYAGNLSKNELPQKLNEISKRYYAQLFVQSPPIGHKNQKRTIQKEIAAYRCPDCGTIYDERYGDILAGIIGGTPFSDLPDSYACQVCETAKSKFLETTVTELAR